LATLGARTWNDYLRHCKRVVRASTLLTYWHGQETSCAGSNVACPSTTIGNTVSVDSDYRIETTKIRSTLERVKVRRSKSEDGYVLSLERKSIWYRLVILNVKAEQGCGSSDPGSCHAFHSINCLV
jgi:hypothetical protein